MSERPVSDLAPAHRLAAETGLLAGRLACLLAETGLEGTGALAGGSAFLRGCDAAARAALGEARAARAVRARGATPAAHPLDRLIDGLQLDPLETELLLLAGLAEEHEGYAALLRGLHPGGEPRASAGLAAQLFCPHGGREALRAALEGGRLVRAGVLQLAGEGPLWERSLLLGERLWSALAGVDAWPAGTRLYGRAAHPAGLEDWLAAAAQQRARRALAQDAPVCLLLTGEHEEGLLWRALALAAAAGRAAVGIALPAATTAEALARLQAHALARGLLPVLQLPGAEPGADGALATPMPAPCALYPGTWLLCQRAGGAAPVLERAQLSLGCAPPAAAVRRAMWAQLLPALADEAPLLAARAPLEPALAHALAADLSELERLSGARAGLPDLFAALRARSGRALPPGVSLQRPQAGWDQLVLPPARLTQLQEAVDRLRLAGRVLDDWGFLAGRSGARGVRMLFYGAPGTGKTLSAEVMAAALQTDLLLVDLSRLVSKWIGETEKNLAAVFDCAERSRAVLFFDEADALFGRRTEVSDAHARYANLETAYLLQRLERYDGLAVLATNLKQNIDPAFMRRLEFALEFDEPDAAQRAQLWQVHLPPAAPLAADVDLAELAALYPVVGGLIRNAAVAAAYLAAAEDAPLARRHLLRALRREYDKAGRAFPGLPAGYSQ